MQEQLLIYFNKQCGSFISNFKLLLDDFDADAIHDMRVSAKRIRAVLLLMERLYPGNFDATEEEGRLRELFRLSGRMRDGRVQQQMLTSNALYLESTFGDYEIYLQRYVDKSIKKFKKFLKEYDAETEMNRIQARTAGLISSTAGGQVRLQIIQLVNELIDTVRLTRPDCEQDETLHEIRRKLKQCLYLLSVFNQSDPLLPQFTTTLKRLDRVNELLGKWHDQLVGMEILDLFLKKFRKKGETGENRYLLLYNNLAENRCQLCKKILSYFSEKLNI